MDDDGAEHHDSQYTATYDYEPCDPECNPIFMIVNCAKNKATEIQRWHSHVLSPSTWDNFALKIQHWFCKNKSNFVSSINSSLCYRAPGLICRQLFEIFTQPNTSVTKLIKNDFWAKIVMYHKCVAQK